ncbi:hypothetical protein HC251_06360 [Iamia sp. SCSIO 61187]|uniref:hypothetical protein n=1 Tax=Iamia sp. SCSIO 61187 TaxID=2722752 RepID=UPI001C6309C9|nr:hypothetical protein [Iamia sp. SCSIO 61187]QYG92099.1 hypothetical protein HC251_06360 [Iamia sp. SCSIO 61187]
MGEPTLLDVGLHVGDVVRFRPRPSARWQEATVERRERDGSIGVRDAKGAARALPLDRLEVPTAGPRGARTWEPLTERAERDVQLDLFLDGAPPPPDPAPSRRRRPRR